jgi:hypothetical protein
MACTAFTKLPVTTQERINEPMIQTNGVSRLMAIVTKTITMKIA